MRIFFAIVFVAIYFAGSWLIPWDELSSGRPISLSYLWDCLFFVAVALIFQKPKFKLKISPQSSARLGFCLFLALVCIGLIKLFSLQTPFIYLSYPFIQLVILAPIFEEIIFRESFYILLHKTHLSYKLRSVILSGLFAISHLFALSVLPAEFSAFIWFQFMYTFILGMILFRERKEQNCVLMPIIQHMGFNLVFYFAIS